MNPNYALKVKEEIDKLLRVGFIWPVKQATWLSPIIVVPRKNGKICVCVHYRKLNAAMVANAFLLPFIDRVLDAVTGHEVYSFLDRFNGYNQIRMHPEDQEKTMFVMKWGVFVVVVMMFELKTAPTTSQRNIMEIFSVLQTTLQFNSSSSWVMTSNLFDKLGLLGLLGTPNEIDSSLVLSTTWPMRTIYRNMPWTTSL